MSQPVFRFAPSPNGQLHLGHAYSALLNLKLARQIGGKILLRIEDIDRVRCTSKLETEMLRDLEWIGFEWDEEPVRQSDRFDLYRDAIDQLAAKGCLYGSQISRTQLKKIAAQFEMEQKTKWPVDPDGALLAPVDERSEPVQKFNSVPKGTALRLNMDRALAALKAPDLYWTGLPSSLDDVANQILARPSEWGDFLIARKETPTSYHLSCVVDDADQNISHVVRGEDLYDATSAQRLLQELLQISSPSYVHHQLIRDGEGRKLSKSEKDTSISQLRDQGISAEQLRAQIGI